VCGDHSGHVVEESFSDESECCVVILCHIIFVSLILHSIVIFAFRMKSECKGREEKNRQNNLRNTCNIIDMIAQRDEQIKE